ncbi:MAG: Type 1 glutamine amidotransferase-like domain-containing protein [Fimbriimonadaceae bacterium]|jgi:cyanophycinase|nr:Type 1 glutamine amidotransferase-like domain-containing protein [Fimbriimonadaceae bacterium]
MVVSLIANSLIASGTLFLVGGGNTPEIVPRRFIEACGGPEALILVIGQVREEPPRAISSVELLQESGAKNVRLIDKSRFTDADKSDLAASLSKAKGVWIPGGDQNLLIKRLGAPWLREHFSVALKRGTHFFGTSAGAMVMSHPMITGNGEVAGTATSGAGIGLVDFLIDTHFRERNREARLRFALRETGHKKAVGLEASEWILVRDGKIIETHGTPFLLGF